MLLLFLTSKVGLGLSLEKCQLVFDKAVEKMVARKVVWKEVWLGKKAQTRQVTYRMETLATIKGPSEVAIKSP